jgi:PAS domain S-box-containing protein
VVGGIEQEPSPGAGEALAERSAVDSLPILVVDDRPENLTAVAAVLEPLGYEVVTAPSGEQALRVLLEQDFGLILLDVRMPGLGGLETARLVKSRLRTQDVPIVFLTAAKDELGDMIRGYGVGAIDYVLKPVDSELLRSKVEVFLELERRRRALQQSEAFLRAAFEGAPIGKTMLDADRRIVRSNPAFARLVGRAPSELQGMAVAELCAEEDRELLTETFAGVVRGDPGPAAPDRAGVDLRLLDDAGGRVWVGLVASTIEQPELSGALLLVQWVDLSARRRAEKARADLLVEHAARMHAESLNDQLRRLQAFSGAIELLSLEELVPELGYQLTELFGVELAEVRIDRGVDEVIDVRIRSGDVKPGTPAPTPSDDEHWEEMPLRIEGESVGVVGLSLPDGRELTEQERTLLSDVAERAALSIRRAQLHEQEHRIAVQLQQGLLPKELPRLDGIELAAHYQAAGLGAETGGDWYDAFVVEEGRLGIVIGDVAGKGIPAASTMGQLRSVTRAFAVADEGTRSPGEVLTRLNRHQLALGQEELFTVIYATLDLRERKLAWANGGHLPPLVRTAAGEVRYLEGGEGLTGIDDVTYVNLEAQLAVGDTLVLFTDGLIERRGESLDAGLERLALAVRDGPQDPAELCQQLLRALLDEASGPPDDVTAFVALLR